jgi:hypothetical protein
MFSDEKGEVTQMPLLQHSAHPNGGVCVFSIGGCGFELVSSKWHGRVPLISESHKLLKLSKK